jgi:hypothetical protein
MLLARIQTELVRLQLHPANLDVVEVDDRLIALRGSLLQYWKLPAIVDAKWLLEVLRVLPDSAGPQAVMSAITAAQCGGDDTPQARAGERTQLRLFDPNSEGSATEPTVDEKDG